MAVPPANVVSRLLPDIAKNVFFKVLYVTSVILRSDIESWCGESGREYV